VEDVINTPREEGNKELAPNVENRGCPRWGCRGIEGTEGGQGVNPICDEFVIPFSPQTI